MMGNFIKDESGQGLVEYVFIMILIAVMLIAVLEILGGSLDNRLPGNVNLSFYGIEGEGLIIVLDMQGICVSSGAACASGSLEPSHVLLALGKSETQAQGSVRITLNEENTEEDVDCISQKLKEAVEHLRSVSPLWDNG